jgi:MFS family permease
MTKNYWLLIGGETLNNISVSLISLSETFFLVNFLKAPIQWFSWISIAAFFPMIFGFVFSPWLANIKQHKKVLMSLETTSILLTIVTILVLTKVFSIWILIILSIFNSITTLLLNAMRYTVMPETLNQDKEKINRAVDISYFLTTTLQIIIGVFFSLIIKNNNVEFLLWIPLIGMFLSLIFYQRLKLVVKDKEDIKEDNTLEQKTNYLKKLKYELITFIKPKFTISIILIEAILSGLTALVLDTLPFSLKLFAIPMSLYGIAKSIQQAGDFFGGLLAPFIRLKTRSFFILDYLISGLAFILITIIPILWIKAVIFFVAFLVIGVSGNVFNKLFYESYEGNQVGAMNTYSTALFSISVVFSLLIPNFISNVRIYWLLSGGITLLAGVVLLGFKISDSLKRKH